MIEYLRHKYTWSSQCITGNRVGWGITGSSTPLDKDKLLELEKLASHAVPDPADRVPVESLIYSPECGFTKMVTLPCHDGEDGRKSKIVRIYQVADLTNRYPEAYISPGDQWDDKQKGDYLEPLLEEPMEINVDDTLIEMGCYDWLPEFLCVILEALFEETESINIVADWPEYDFAVNSRRMIYAIHMMIPDALRKKASYQSFAREETNHVTFYFSREICGRNYIRLGNLVKKKIERNDELEEFFYQKLAESYVKRDGTYPEFMDKMSEFYLNHGNDSNNLRKLQWIFAALCIRQGEDPFTQKYLIAQLPQLFYWCEDDEELNTAVEGILEYFHEMGLDAGTALSYQNSLVMGYTKKSEELIARETAWSMKKLFRLRPDLFKQQLNKIKHKNTNIYSRLMMTDIDSDESFAGIMFQNNSANFEQLKNYLFSLNIDLVTDEFKDKCLIKGIDFLNKDLFRLEYYQSFDELVKKLGRQEQGVYILINFVTQLEELRTKLDDEKLETACYVEQLINSYEGEERYTLLAKEKAARKVKPAPVLSVMEAASANSALTKDITDEIVFDEKEVAEAKKRRQQREKAKKENALSQPNPKRRERRYVGQDSFLNFFLNTIPMGFITGCAIFMVRYSLKIGHGKIALGMLGVWMIVILNYLAYLQMKQKTIRTWQTIGLFLVEGVVVSLLGGVLSAVHLHLFYFMILGVVSMFFSANNFLQEREKRVRKK